MGVLPTQCCALDPVGSRYKGLRLAKSNGDIGT